MGLDPLKILEELVEIKSVNNPGEGVKPSIEAAKYIQEKIRGIGVESDIIEVDGYYSVFGKIGSGRPAMLFMAHFDTVPANPSQWSYPPFKLTIVDGKGYGRGSVDDKGNVAAIMAMLSNLVERSFNGTVLFAFTGDEEVGGRRGAAVIRDRLVKSNLKPDYLVNCDGHGMMVIIRRRCGFSVRIKVPSKKVRITGKIVEKRFEVKTPVYETRHAAYFMPGVDTHPLIAASEYLMYHPNVMVASVKGGFIKSNVIPSWIELKAVEKGEGEEYTVDEGLTQLIRTIIPIVRSPVKPEKYSDYGVSITPNIYVEEDGFHRLVVDVRAMTINKEDLTPIKEAVLENIPEAEVEIRGGIGYLYTDKNEDIVMHSLNILKELGVESKTMEGAGASDSRYFAPIGVKCIDFGPLGGNVHGPNEYVVIDSLYTTAKFYEKLALKLLG